MISSNSHFKDISNQKFGKLLVISFISGHKRAKWKCKCDCGEYFEVYGWRLRNGSVKSCGCSRIKHGYLKGGRHPIYRVWQGILERCNKETHKSYKDYGGRGIKVCDRWLKFENFIADMGDRPSDKHSIERINNNGNYEKSNCRWALKSEQAKNSRNNHMIEFNGKIQSMKEWADELGLNYKTLRTRIHRGWSIERALTT